MFYAKKILPFFVIILFFAFAFAGGVAAQNTKHIIITTGSSGGNYYKTGKKIEEILNKNFDDIAFHAVEGGGSFDNIKKLKQKEADFAIVQQDIFFNEFYGNNKGLKNVVVLMPLYQEMFLIYAHGEKYLSIKDFAEHIANNKVKIGVTSKNSTSYKTLKSVSELLDINLKNASFVEGTYSDLIKLFKENKIDYLVSFSLPLSDLENIAGITKVYFDPNEVDFLLNSRFRKLSKIVFDSGKQSMNTMGVPSLIVANADVLSEEQLNRVVNVLFENFNSDSDDFILKNIKKTVSAFQSHNANPNISNHVFVLPVYPETLKLLGYKHYSITKYLDFLFVFVVVLFMIGLLLSRKENVLSNNVVSKLRYFSKRYRHIFISLSLSALFYFIFVWLLLRAETQLFLQTAVKSDLLNMSFSDLNFWNLIRIFSGNDAGVFPISNWGKIFLSFSSYTIWIGGIVSVGVEYMHYRLFSKRKKGMVAIKKTGHLVIAGWNDSTEQLIKDIILATREYDIGSKLHIVIITENPEEIINSKADIEALFKKQIISFVAGNIRQRATMEKANIHRASKIIFIAKDRSVQADENVLLSVLSAHKFCKEKKIESDGKYEIPYMIAQINNKDFADDLYNAGANGIISSSKLIDGILIQTMLNPGVAKLLNNILSFSEDTNEFYTINMLDKENHHLRYKTFDELLPLLRSVGILLISIRIIYRNEEGLVVSEENELQQMLKNDGLYRQIITNPLTYAEINYKVDDDQLIVLARTGRDLKEGIVKLKKIIEAKNSGSP